MRKGLMLLTLVLLALLWGCEGEPEFLQATEITETCTAPAETVPPETVIQATGDWIDGIYGGKNCCLVVSGFEEGWQGLTVYGLPQGEVLGRMRLEGLENGVQLLEDGTVVTLTGNGTCLEAFDRTLTKCFWQWSGQEAGMFGSAEDFLAVGEDGEILRITLEDGRETRLETELEMPSLVASCPEQGLFLHMDPDGNYIQSWVDWETGETEPRENDRVPMILPFGMEEVVSHDCRFLRNPEDGEVYGLKGDRGDWIVDVGDGKALLSNGAGFTLWDLRWGTTWELETESWLGTICGQTVVYCDGADRLHLWPYGQEEPETDRAEVWSVQELEIQNRADAAAVHLETGMKVLYGEEGAAFPELGSFGYCGKPETDSLIIHLALESLLTFTRQYPKGIFREMVTEPVEEIRIFLSGPLSPDGPESLGSASGFTGAEGEVRVLVMNLDYAMDDLYFRQTLAHEFMHAMEDRIFACEEADGIHYLGYWESFEPGEDAYYYSYFDEDGLEVSDPAYTAASDLQAWEVSFLDSYSRTFPHEDRARVLEYLYAGADSEYAYLFQEGELRDKAMYLCAVIRQCYPSCREAESLPWESLVGPASFETYREAVASYVPVAKG